MRGKLSLQTIFTTLRELGGYFTFAADEGDEYVVISKKEFDNLKNKLPEIQLALPAADPKPGTEPVNANPTAHQELDKINKDITEYQLNQNKSEHFDHLDDDQFYEEDIDNMPASEDLIQPDKNFPDTFPSQPDDIISENDNDEQSLKSVPPRPPAIPSPSVKSVHFEPLRGDLPPELQP